MGKLRGDTMSVERFRIDLDAPPPNSVDSCVYLFPR